MQTRKGSKVWDVYPVTGEMNGRCASAGERASERDRSEEMCAFIRSRDDGDSSDAQRRREVGHTPGGRRRVWCVCVTAYVRTKRGTQEGWGSERRTATIGAHVHMRGENVEGRGQVTSGVARCSRHNAPAKTARGRDARRSAIGDQRRGRTGKEGPPGARARKRERRRTRARNVGAPRYDVRAGSREDDAQCVQTGNGVSPRAARRRVIARRTARPRRAGGV